MGKKAFMNKIKEGKTKEITVSGEQFLIKAPKLKDYGDIMKFYGELEERGNVDFSTLVKMVIDNTYDVETGEQYFTKGDFEALKNDRNGAIKKIGEFIMELMVVTEEEKENTKKK